MMVEFKMHDSVPTTRYSPFVMYCVNGKPRSSLLIESTDSMIFLQDRKHILKIRENSRNLDLFERSRMFFE